MATLVIFLPFALHAPFHAPEGRTQMGTKGLGGVGLTRRFALLSGSALVAASITPPRPIEAIGPVNIDLDVKAYEEIQCPPELAAGRIGGSIGAGASKGVKQRCIKVTASATNPQAKPVKDAAVFGRVFNGADNNSVVANNPDGRTDAGQFAMIDTIKPGANDIDFVFVATDSKGSEMGQLRFESLKAISYPGGDRYKPYDPCEQNEAMEGCGMD